MPKSLFLPGYSLNSELGSQDATILIGWCTFLLHFLAAFYFLDVYRGGSSDWVASPIFEYSNGTMHTVAIGLAIFSFLHMMVASPSLIRGVKTETRIYYFPWFIMTALDIMLLVYQAAFLWWRYSYDANTCIILVVILILAFYLTYFYLIVLSNYRYLKRIQSPTLVFLPEV